MFNLFSDLVLHILSLLLLSSFGSNKINIYRQTWLLSLISTTVCYLHSNFLSEIAVADIEPPVEPNKDSQNIEVVNRSRGEMDSGNNTPQFRNIKIQIGGKTLTLPEEIIEEILSRLPVKSLLKFRCVSKSWCSLISSKRFIKTHLHNSTKNSSFSRHKIILYSMYDRVKLVSFRSFSKEPLIDQFKFDDSVTGPWESVRLVGCCDGLLCILFGSKKLQLGNPSTRMSKNLPDIDNKSEAWNIINYGFGHDKSSGDYKVFAIISDIWAITKKCKLYSLKTNSWKTIETEDVPPSDPKGKFASGNLHWNRGDDGSRRDIVCFDLKSEVYGVVELPSYSEGGFSESLGVIGGCLSIVCEYPNSRIDVWVMKQYGVKESWAKVATVSVSHLQDPEDSPFSIPFAVGPNGEILLIYGWRLLIVREGNVSQHPRIISIDTLKEADVYIESLVSLDLMANMRGNPRKQLPERSK